MSERSEVKYSLEVKLMAIEMKNINDNIRVPTRGCGQKVDIYK